MAVLPKNLSMVVQRLANFNRQTIRLRSMSNDTASPGQTIVFRFPSNTIVDLHCLQLKATLNSQFSCNVAQNSVGAATPAATGGATCYGELGMPRYTQGLFERVDVTVGGTTISGSNIDYGGIYTLLRDALCSSVARKPFGEMTKTDGDSNESKFFNMLHLFDNPSLGDPINQGTAGTSASTTGAPVSVYNESAGGNPYSLAAHVAGTSDTTNGTGTAKTFDGCSFGTNPLFGGIWKQEPIVFQGFLGLLGGKFVRFIDTSITGAIEIRIRLAPLAVCWGPHAVYPGKEALRQGVVSSSLTNRSGNYYLSDLYMIMDTISFTDDFYRQLLARRLIEGGSIVIPYDNYFSINKYIGSSGDTVSFNIATQSLDYLVGTLRRSDYNSTPSNIGLCEVELAGTVNNVGIATANSVYGKSQASRYMKPFKSASYNPNYYTFVSGTTNDIGNNGTTFQWLVCNQMVPTWPADANDVWLLNQAALDIADAIGDVGNVSTHYEFRRGKFAHITCFNHHAETEKFISGLDTRGASSNMQWMVQNMLAPNEWRNKDGTTSNVSGKVTYNATVWACCTSTLEISAGQNIVVIF